MVKSLSESAASETERCAGSVPWPRLLCPQSAWSQRLHCVIALMPPNCRRTVKRVAHDLLISQSSFPFAAFCSDHSRGIHLNVSGVCAQRGWSKSPNRARNYAPSGREKCSESWRSCTTARARHLSQVKQTNPLRQFGNDGSERASRSKRLRL